jgi:hypothetical protein
MALRLVENSHKPVWFKHIAQVARVRGDSREIFRLGKHHETHSVIGRVLKIELHIELMPRYRIKFTEIKLFPLEVIGAKPDTLSLFFRLWLKIGVEHV